MDVASVGSATVHHVVVGGRFTFIHIFADPGRVHFFFLAFRRCAVSKIMEISPGVDSWLKTFLIKLSVGSLMRCRKCWL